MKRWSSLALAGLVSLALVAAPASGAPAQTPKRGGRVVHGGPFGEPACFTPVPSQCAPGASALSFGFIVSKVLAAPFKIGPDLTWQPELVAEWKVDTTPPFTLTYRIRAEARWSDGVPVTADDFVFTRRALVRLAPEGSEDPNVAMVRSVRAVDSKTVRIVLRKRYSEWRGLFGGILPSHALRGQDLTQVWRRGIDHPGTGRPIGSGPFLMESWERGRQLVLRRNPRYWGPHPAHLDRVVVRFQLTPEAAREALRRGELDLATHFPPAPARELATEPGARLLSNQRGAGWEHLAFQRGPFGHPALRSKLVRRALAYGLDREAIVRLPAFASVTGRVRQSVVFPNRDSRYEPNWRQYRHRPALARRLLAEAGCERGGDGIASCDGRRLALRLVTTVIPGGFRPDVVQLIQSQLRAVGVEIVPQYYPPGPLFTGIFSSRNFDVVLFAWVSGPDRALAAKEIFGCDGQSNVTGYCQRLVTAELDQALRILDPERQAHVLNRADALIAKDVPVIPLYQQTQTVVVRSSIRNFGLSMGTQGNPLWNAENWWLDD